MQRAILVATLTAIFGCDTQTPDELCARFGLVPDLARDACRCPDGTTRSEDDTGCLLPDGGFLPFPDASVPDSSTRDGGAPDVGTDRDTGPDCTVMPFYRDRDGDGFGSMLDRVEACEAPSGYVSTSDDCDDECAECRPGGTEACDGIRDEDCDGTTDESCECVVGSMRACPGGSDTGACVAGTQMCTEDGVWGNCVGAIGPVAETCDAIDNDCDTIPDNGTAAASCASVSRATGVGCSAGACFVSSCASGYHDCDGMFANGCEAQLGTIAACLSCGDACGWDCEPDGCNDAVSVSAGGSHTCAVRQSGTVACWGANSSGQLGDGTVTARVTPVSLAMPTGIAELALGGLHSCALSTGGLVHCWGENGSGQLGDGTDLQRTSPILVPGLSSVTSIAAGGSHTCATLTNRTVRCWGLNANGQLGDATTMNRNTPVQVSAVTGATKVALGSRHSCALLSDGRVRCWGDNRFGQLGDGTTTSPRTTSVLVSGLSNVSTIAAAFSHTCAISEGLVYCWGSNGRGQLGNGTTSSSNTPVLVSGLTNAVELSSGLGSDGYHTCARRGDGSVWCWGENGSGQIGDGTTSDRRAPVMVLPSASRIAVGRAHSCAVAPSGGVMCWGENEAFQLGDGSAEDRLSPVSTTAPNG